MPLFFEQQTYAGGALGIWRIKEDEAYFLNRAQISEAELAELSKIKGKGRRLQWLSVRHLLRHLMRDKPSSEMLKDEFGKPQLMDSNLYISMSHSKDLAAAMIAPVSCGIDIQFPVPKIRRIVPRFCSRDEKKHIKSDTDLKTMHVIWGAKECIYKSYGRRRLDYKRDISVKDPHLLFDKPGIGILSTKEFTYTYDLFAEDVLEYVLTYCFKVDAL